MDFIDIFMRLVERERVTVYYYAGLVESYDPMWRTLDSPGVAPDFLRAALDRISRFYAK